MPFWKFRPSARLPCAPHSARTHPSVRVGGSGERMEIYKEVGLPGDVARRFELSRMTGTHGIGHTRMATELAVTTDGAHPFSTGATSASCTTARCRTTTPAPRSEARRHDLRDRQRHRGRRRLPDLAHARGATRSAQALSRRSTTSTASTPSSSAPRPASRVLRDPIACKPAVMAETDHYVAFGSEYRALVDLPGIDNARVWEPEPATVYFWERAA